MREVLVKLNNGLYNIAVGKEKWFIPLSLSVGENMLEIVAVDFSGNYSDAIFLQFDYFPPDLTNDHFVNARSLHVENLDLYLQSCYDLLKRNGLMFTATINRTLISYIKAIIGAEYVLRWLPIGTHDWNKFVKPEELQKKLTDKKFTTNNIKGLEFNPIFNKWKQSDNLSVNYIICSSKN